MVENSGTAEGYEDSVGIQCVRGSGSEKGIFILIVALGESERLTQWVVIQSLQTSNSRSKPCNHTCMYHVDRYMYMAWIITCCSDEGGGNVQMVSNGGVGR